MVDECILKLNALDVQQEVEDVPTMNGAVHRIVKNQWVELKCGMAKGALPGDLISAIAKGEAEVVIRKKVVDMTAQDLVAKWNIGLPDIRPELPTKHDYIVGRRSPDKPITQEPSW